MAREGLKYLPGGSKRDWGVAFNLWKLTNVPCSMNGWGNWSDLTDFEVYPVITSAEAAERIGSWVDCHVAGADYKPVSVPLRAIAIRLGQALLPGSSFARRAKL